MKAIIQALWGPPGLILLGAILSAIGALWASQQKGIFERELRIKSDEIAELNKEIVKSVIGGDSFCYLMIASLDPHRDSGILMIIHQGGHPIYDVSARMADLQKMKAIEKDNMDFREVMQANTNIQIGNMAKGTAAPIGPFQLGSGTERNFNIFFSARNGLFTQLLRLKKINNKWVHATKVERDGKIIFEKIDGDFPRNSDASVRW
ncbi:MAG: hypothetical protein ACOYU4_07900 [Thermodesulfobacteriota bacterium]